MDNKQIYETVRKHLLTQMAKSEDGNAHYMCAYRGPNGLKCAIGCLIPDDAYYPGMEGRDVVDMLSQWPEHPFDSINISLLERLQAIHDNLDPSDWENQLDALRQEWRL